MRTDEGWFTSYWVSDKNQLWADPSYQNNANHEQSMTVALQEEASVAGPQHTRHVLVPNHSGMYFDGR